jgi:CelD/BcsL family acetyltransferase involved in cellulose biosynthesis
VKEVVKSVIKESKDVRQEPGCEPAIRQIDPLRDPRWTPFLKTHPQSSIFHTVAWLKALRSTYGYEPVAFTSASGGEPLQDGLVCCRVDSWLTGRRLVSVPFADHCEVLADMPGSLLAMINALEESRLDQRLKYVEIRPLKPLTGASAGLLSDRSFSFHQIDLSPAIETLFAGFHKDSTQRKIRRAEREGLIYAEGRSEALLDTFYRLLVITRRRHQLPPQPKKWFRNLIGSFGEDLKIRVASKEARAVAAILTIRHKDTLVYKYGCSDAESNNLGGTQLLFWRAIQEAKQEGLNVFDLGRSDSDNPGLITFKDRLGSERSTLKYFRLGQSGSAPAANSRPDGWWKTKFAKDLLSLLPDAALHSIGEILYKHMG